MNCSLFYLKVYNIEVKKFDCTYKLLKTSIEYCKILYAKEILNIKKNEKYINNVIRG